MSNFYLESKEKLEEKYSAAAALRDNAETLDDIRELISLLHSIAPYRDSTALLHEAYNLLKTEQNYQRALWIISRAESSDDFKELIGLLRDIRGYKDCAGLLAEAEKSLEQAEAEEDRQRMRKIYASVLCAAVFAALCFGGYRLKLWRDRVAHEEAVRKAEQQAHTMRVNAMQAFFDGRNEDAVSLLKYQDSVGADIVFSDMLAILGYNDSGRTYYSLHSKDEEVPGRPVTWSEALELAEKSSGAQAKIFLGDMHFAGRIISQDLEKAIELYSVPAESDDVYAQVATAEVYEFLKDYAAAEEWYKRAEEQGDKGASAALVNIKRILNYVELSKTGNPEAQYNEGQLYMDSTISENVRRGFELILKAAKQNYAPAQYELGEIYRKGNSQTQKDSAKALENFQKAADKGDPAAQFALAEMYENGEGVEKDNDKALSLYHKAASRNYPKSYASLGRLYYLKKDYANALRYYLSAAQTGDSTAQYYTGRIYEQGGAGITQDFDKAYEWYRKSAAQGSSDAQKALQRINDKLSARMSVRGTKINLRSQPGTNSESILQLDEGTPVEVLQRTQQNNTVWLFVRLPSGKTGWISGAYVQPRLPDKGRHGGYYMAVKGYDVNLRESYSKNSGSVAKLNDGNIVEVIGKRSMKDGTWYQVYTLNDQSGWVFGRYVRDRAGF